VKGSQPLHGDRLKKVDLKGFMSWAGGKMCVVACVPSSAQCGGPETLARLLSNTAPSMTAPQSTPNRKWNDTSPRLR
jgi:hypothetical protein